LNKLDVSTQLTPSMIMKFIEGHASERARLQRLYNYYLGKQDILNKFYDDASKPCNKIVSNFCQLITSSYVGYLFGNSVAYSSDNTEQLEALKQVFNYNDSAENDANIGTDCSIYGVGYELVFIDEDSQIRHKRLNPLDIIPIYDNSLNENLLYAIRYFYQTDIMDNTETLFVEVYTQGEIINYTSVGNNLVETDRKVHFFGICPVIPYFNNADRQGDFEQIISLQDAINKLNSYGLDNEEAFADAYLVLKAMEGTSSEDIQNAKINRTLLIPENGEASFLTKQINDVYIENLKNRIVADIYKISCVPDITNDGFATTSGVAIRYKILPFEQKTSVKERFFKKGTQKKIELITAYFNTLGASYDYRDIGITFSRALPTSETETAQVVSQLQGLVSSETLLGLLPFVEDAKAELERKNAESSLDMNIDFTGSDELGQQ